VLALEMLEDRCCLSTTAASSPEMAIEYAGSTLAIIRDNPTDPLTTNQYGKDGVLAQVSGLTSAMSAIAYDIKTIQNTDISGGGPVLKIQVSNNIMTIVGNNAGDQVNIDLNWNGHGGVLAQITGPNAAISAVAFGIKTVQFEGGNGNDQVTVTESAKLAQNLTLDLNVGNGHDQVNLGLQAGVSGHKVAIDVNGGTGKDQVSLNLGAVTGATLGVQVALHGSGDSFAASLNGDLTAQSNVLLQVAGGAGNDTLSFNAASVKVGAGSALEADLTGGSGADKITTNYEGLLLGQLTLHSYGGAGNNTLVANITADPLSTGKLDVLVKGGAGDDNLTVHFYDDSSFITDPPAALNPMFLIRSLLSSVKILADGGGGFNTLHRTYNIPFINCQKVDPLIIPL